MLALVSCSRSSRQAADVGAGQELEGALRPEAAVAGMRKLAGGHWHATATFRISPVGADAGSPEAITTTTDLWMDKAGNFRLVESNDQANGREVVRVGGELALAISGGRLVRRPAQEPEATRYLKEALGAPWAAWDTVRLYTNVERDGGGLRLSLRSAPLAGTPAATPGRRWRDSVQVQSLEGHAELHAGTRALQSFALRARFTAKREHMPIQGEIVVDGRLLETGASAPVAMPDAGILPSRQRTTLDERALLGGLGAPKGEP